MAKPRKPKIPKDLMTLEDAVRWVMKAESCSEAEAQHMLRLAMKAGKLRAWAVFPKPAGHA